MPTTWSTHGIPQLHSQYRPPPGREDPKENQHCKAFSQQFQPTYHIHHNKTLPPPPTTCITFSFTLLIALVGLSARCSIVCPRHASPGHVLLHLLSVVAAAALGATVQLLPVRSHLPPLPEEAGRRTTPPPPPPGIPTGAQEPCQIQQDGANRTPSGGG